MIITDGELEMKDDERMRRIAELRTDMQSKYRFCREFSKDTQLMATQRSVEHGEVNRSKKIHGLN